ncbi:Metallo-dependent hydrolase [Periconia macrospinosa]|uniref:Metallo-dependent hydrolase n=1 Tax=Periconia macrospinosa TaxID=97972 RepID=A0A2V1E805_9PLEO|nr:Metallo-dependent hydrolase [Periconia macrospinosa]
MSTNKVLLKNGTVLLHGASDQVESSRVDVLIVGGNISKLGKDIEVPRDAEIIDCSHKIISPGFIDTHHHGWQTQLKGRHGNELLLEYLITGNYQHAQYTVEDVFYGQLAGMLEALSAGTTTVVDHAHITVSPDHPKLGIAATASSGVRAVYCYAAMDRLKSFNPLMLHENALEDWVMQTFSELADAAPFGNGRVSLGFAWDLWFIAPELIKNAFEKVREKNIRLITTHGTNFFSVLQFAKKFGVMDSRLLVSHGGDFSKEDGKLLREAGAHISATPSTELQMAMGRPLCFDAAFLDPDASVRRSAVQDRASLGIDCHSNNAGSIVSEARLGLQNARNHFNEYNIKQGKGHDLPYSLSVEAAFNLATIKGAQAAKMEKEIGKIAEGYKADLAIFDALSPSMIGAAQHDPVAAIILHSSPADIDMVVVDGIIRKRNGKLLPVNVDATAKEIVGKETLEWHEIAQKILRSREVIQRKTEDVDVQAGVESVRKIWHISENF